MRITAIKAYPAWVGIRNQLSIPRMTSRPSSPKTTVRGMRGRGRCP